MRADNANVVIIGVDNAETAQQRIGSTSLDLYLVGYVTSGAVFFTNGLDKSTGTTGSYVDVDITADVGANAANGAFLEIYNSSGGGSRELTAVRPNGATYDYYVDMQHQFALVGLDSGDIFEQKIAHTDMDVFMVGYSLSDGSPSFRVQVGLLRGQRHRPGDHRPGLPARHRDRRRRRWRRPVRHPHLHDARRQQQGHRRAERPQREPDRVPRR